VPERVPQSATIRVPLQAYLASDHVSPALGKTIAVTVSKNGGAYANPSGGATNAVEIGSGSYYVDLSTTDVGTAGPLFVKGAEGTIDTVTVVYQVVNAHHGGFDALPDAAAEAAGGVITRGAGAGQLNVSGGKAPATLAAADVSGNLPAVANAVAANAIDAGSIAANAITASECPALAGLDAPVSSRAAAGAAMTLADGAITDAKFGFAADPSAAPAGIVSTLWWLLCRSGLRKFVYDRLTGKGQVYRADGVTVWTSNTITATGNAQTTGAITAP
jgi:hypothetical protein